MSKRKNRVSNPLKYWWNEILFARYFEYETDLTPTELSEKLSGLAHPHQGGYFGLLKKANVKKYPNNKGLDFDIQSKRKRKWDFIAFTTARAQGSAQVNKSTGQTIMRGAVKFGRLFHLFMLFYLFYFLVVIPQVMFAGIAEADSIQIIGAMMFPLLILGSMMGFYWWRIYKDRNDLALLIEDITYQQKSKRASEHLAMKEHSEDAFIAYEEDDIRQEDQR